MLDEFQGQRYVEPLARTHHRISGRDAVIDAEAARVGMHAGGIDRLGAGIDPGHGKAEPRHRLGDKAAAAADVDQGETVERPQRARVAAEMGEQVAADESDARGVYPMERSKAAAGIPPARAMRGKAVDVLAVYSVAFFVHPIGSPRSSGCRGRNPVRGAGRLATT